MSDHKHELEQMLQAATGLGATAGASALRSVAELSREEGTRTTLDRIAILSSLSDRARTCMHVAAKAEADGDERLAELGWLQALSLMNHMTEESTAGETRITQEEEFFAQQAAGRVH